MFWERLVNDLKKVIVKVPATTANMGPGFDCFGCAFTMYNTLTFEEIEAGYIFEGFEPQYENEDNLAIQGYLAVMKRLGIPAKGLKMTIDTDIPICRGLGSSSSMLAASAIAANVLHGSPLSKQELLEICTHYEGHPDNLAPCLFGGMTASMMVGDRPVTVRYAISKKIGFVALIPDFEFCTSVARAALPKTLLYRDAVFNVSHGAILLKALENGDEELIALSMADRFHEPYRKPLIQGSDVAEQAARDCGALAFVLSGAGPTFMCLTTDKGFEGRIRNRLADLLPSWTVRPLSVDYVGATYELISDEISIPA